jgi:hypothetical protein
VWAPQRSRSPLDRRASASTTRGHGDTGASNQPIHSLADGSPLVNNQCPARGLHNQPVNHHCCHRRCGSQLTEHRAGAPAHRTAPRLTGTPFHAVPPLERPVRSARTSRRSPRSSVRCASSSTTRTSSPRRLKSVTGSCFLETCSLPICLPSARASRAPSGCSGAPSASTRRKRQRRSRSTLCG